MNKRHLVSAAEMEPEMKKNPTDETVTYSITIQTNDAYSEAGTQSYVMFQLVGEDGSSTAWHEFKWFWSNDIKPGEVEHIKVEATNIGLPIIVRIKVRHDGGMDEWLCDRIVVKLGGQRVEFPVYDWIEDVMEVTRGEAQLSQKVTNPYVQSLRRHELEMQKIKFSWSLRPCRDDLAWGMNRVLGATTYDELPLLFKREEERASGLQKKRLNALIQAYAHRISSAYLGINKLGDYHRLYMYHSVEQAQDNALDGWDTDEFMGRVTLNGISPLSFYRCSELPDGFTVTNDDVRALLREGKTLQDEMKTGLIYVSDYRKLLEGLPRNRDFQGRQIYCADAQGMFYVRPDKKFVPIAIQLVPGDREHLFTATDSKYDWLLAKMYFRAAEATFHQWIVHFLKTHGIIETVGIALFRCLPRAHPVHKLFRNLVKNAAAINLEARQNLIPPEGRAQKASAVSASEMVRRVFKKFFRFEDLIIPKLIKKLGLDDRELLPNYHFRDDTLELWQIMKKFVHGVLSNYYKCDKDVVQDFELQDWWQDLVFEGVAWQDGDTKGFPDRIDSYDQLLEICLTLMYTSSAQHAAVNFGQFDTYKFIPSATGGMMLPPHKRREGSMERIMAALPGARISGVLIAFAYVLSTYPDNEVYLGEFPQRLFTDEPTLQCQAQFKADLDEFSAKIKERNSHLEHPYTYLLPERIPFGITI